MAGMLTAQLLDEKTDVNGTTFLEAATAAGYGGSSHQVWGSISFILRLITVQLLHFCPLMGS